LKHVGNFFNLVGTIIEGRLDHRPGEELPRRPAGLATKDWMADRLDRLMSAWAGIPDDALVWNFTSETPAPIGFWLRRQVPETAIHRVDAELACSLPVSGLEPGIGADCVSEFLQLLGFTEKPATPDAPTSEVPQTESTRDFMVHLHATDIDGAEWTIDTVDRTVTRAHAKGDAAIRGTAWALARWCWGRPVGGEIEAFGDIDAAESWRRSIAV
jgi:hypothetical protein